MFEAVKVTNVLSKEQLKGTGYPVYSSDTTNSGIIGLHDEPEFIIKGNECYVIFGDHTRTLNIASQSFSVLDNVKVLKPKYTNKRALLFIFAAWQKAIPNLGYARHWKRAKDIVISLPITPSGEPDFKLMEKFIRAIEKESIKEVAEYKDRVIEETKRIIKN